LLICGQLLIMPQTYIKVYGHKNVFLLNGLVGLLGIPGQLLRSVLSQWVLVNLGYFWLFTIFNAFSAIGNMILTSLKYTSDVNLRWFLIK
jgi:hypothetical protein